MTEHEVIQRLCRLATEVGEHFEHKLPHDCFCGDSPSTKGDRFQFDEEIVEFMERAVRGQMAALEDRAAWLSRVHGEVQREHAGEPDDDRR